MNQKQAKRIRRMEAAQQLLLEQQNLTLDTCHKIIVQLTRLKERTETKPTLLHRLRLWLRS